MRVKIHVGFLGLGNIGSGVWQLIQRRHEQLCERDQVDFLVKRVLVRSLEKPRSVPIEDRVLTTDPQDILQDDSIGLVAEFMGGLEPARSYLIEALKRGKTVVTANKVVVSQAWEELNEAAREGGGGLYYEASAAGGIPVIGALNRSLQANAVSEIMGIVNGTTNAILTNMAEAGWDYPRALADAQEKGYAEPDPSLDVGGQDAAYKLAILASLAFGQRVRVEDIYCEGITRITREDIQYGQSLGLTLKLMAIGRVENGTLQVRVHPTFIPDKHPMATVRGAFNAIYLKGDAAGEIMLYGRGAGAMPTASAVVSDMVVAACCGGHHERPAFLEPTARRAGIPLTANWKTAYYIHIRVKDEPGALGAFSSVLGKHGVSLRQVIQLGQGSGTVPIVVITHPAGETALRAAVDEMALLDVVDQVVNVIRVEKEA